MMTKWLVTAALVALATPAHAANWQRVTAGNDGARFMVYLDTKSVVRNGPVASAVLKSVYTPARKMTSGALTVHAAYVMDSQQFDCAKRTTALVSSTYYDAAGKVLSAATQATVDFEDIEPESVAEDELKAVCRK
jgi:hypothetical protein